MVLDVDSSDAIVFRSSNAEQITFWLFNHVSQIKDCVELLIIFASLGFSLYAFFKTRALERSQEYDNKFGAIFLARLDRAAKLVEDIHVLSMAPDALSYADEASDLLTNYHKSTAPLHLTCSYMDKTFGANMVDIVESYIDICVSCIQLLINNAPSLGNPPTPIQGVQTLLLEANAKIELLRTLNDGFRKNFKKFLKKK